GGFTEFVALPFVPHNAPIYLARLAPPRPTWRGKPAGHARARLLLHGRIPHNPCSWGELGGDSPPAVLRGGCNDPGGTRGVETISRMAGSEHGSARSVAELEALAARAGRPARQRSTTYTAVVPSRH